MKIRLAKKIMKYKSIVDEYNNGDGSKCDGIKESYWLKRMFDHINGVYDETFDTPAHIPFKDHRITKAISLTSKKKKTMKNETFDFSEALRRMKEGKKVRRIIWEECGAYIHIVSETIVAVCDGKFFPCVFKDSEDILANDWEEV